MILSCPDCATRFLVNEALLEPHGRKVKCAKCQHVWFQEPPAQEESINELEQELPKVEDIPEAVRPIPEGSGLPIVADEDGFSILRVAAVFVGMIFLVTALLIPFKESVVHVWEPSAKLFETFGIPVMVDAEGIAIEDIKAIETIKEAQGVVIVSGFLRNTVDEHRKVLPLNVSLWGARGDEPLETFSFETDFSILNPGQSSKFEYMHPVTRPGVEAIEISFASGNHHD